MPYVRAYGRQGPGRVAYGALGCGPCGNCAGCTRALGDVGDDQTRLVRALQAQVNRFVPSVFPTKVRVTGVLDLASASMAMGVMALRATGAIMQSADEDTKALLTTALQNQVNPQPFVTQNLPLVVETVKLFGDYKGLPAAAIGLDFLLDKRVLVGAGALAALFLLRRGR